MCLVGRLPSPMYAGPGTATSPNNPVVQDTISITRQALQSRMFQETTSNCFRLRHAVLWRFNLTRQYLLFPIQIPLSTLVFRPVVASWILIGTKRFRNFINIIQSRQVTGVREETMSVTNVREEFSVRTSTFQISPKPSVSCTFFIAMI